MQRKTSYNRKFSPVPARFHVISQKVDYLWDSILYCAQCTVYRTWLSFFVLYSTRKPETRKQCNSSHLYSVFVRLGSLNRYRRWLKSAIQHNKGHNSILSHIGQRPSLRYINYNLRKFSHFRIFAHKQRFCCNSYLFIFYINVYSIDCNTIQRFSQLNKNGLFQVSPLQYVL